MQCLLQLNNLHGCGRRESKSTNILDTSCVLDARLAGMNSEKLRSYHASFSLTPPPSTYCYPKIEKEVPIAAEKEAKASMGRAAKNLQTQMGIDITTKCTHVLASIDCAYHSSFCFSSIISPQTQKILAYLVISNRCATCSYYRGKEKNLELTVKMRQSWGAHKSNCLELPYQDYEDVHLESAVAIELIEQAHERGIVFDTLVCDGDNDTVGSLNESGAYHKLDINLKIKKILCLAHVMRSMMK